jgi:hypothetical protein
MGEKSAMILGIQEMANAQREWKRDSNGPIELYYKLNRKRYDCLLWRRYGLPFRTALC